MSWLLDAGVDPNQGQGRGGSAIMFAAEYGHLDVVQRLLDASVVVDSVDLQGITALSYAARKGHLAVAKLLVSAGADKDRVDSAGATPLIRAVGFARFLPSDRLSYPNAYLSLDRDGRGHLEIVRFLIEAGADISKAEINGITPLLAAVAGSNLEAVVELLKAGADPKESQDNGDTALILAADYNESLEIAKVLMKAGAPFPRMQVISHPLLKGKNGGFNRAIMLRASHRDSLTNMLVVQRRTSSLLCKAWPLN